LATIDMNRRVGADVPPFGGGELGPHLTQYVALAEIDLRTKWHLDPTSRLAVRRPKNGGCAPF